MINFKKMVMVKVRYVLLLMIIFFTFSCLDTDYENSQNTPTAYVSFYNGANATTDIKIEVDGKEYDRRSFDFGQYIDYWYFFTGERSFSFLDPVSNQSLLDTAVNLEVEKVYSFFMTETMENLTTLFVEDSLESPVTGKALIRLVHLSPDSPEVTLFQRDQEDNTLGNLSFMEITDFVNVNPGETDFILKAANGGPEELVRLNDVILREGRIYTLIVRGKDQAASNSADALSIQLIRTYPNY